MKISIISFLLFFIIISNNDKVYICNGPNSKVFHRSIKCRGLKNCSTKISLINKNKALELGRRACKIEFK